MKKIIFKVIGYCCFALVFYNAGKLGEWLGDRQFENKAIINRIETKTKKTMPSKPLEINQMVVKSASFWGIPVNLLRALIQIESSWRIQVVSHKGAIGLGQITPYMARVVCGIHDSDLLLIPQINIDCTAQILAYHIAERGTYKYALIEYNGGWSCLKNRWCKESENYYKKVLKEKAKLDNQQIASM